MNGEPLSPSENLHTLRLNDLSLQVKLGCTVEERTRPQEVRVSVELQFDGSPKGIFSDALEDTICYAEVCKVIKERCERREFQLIERLAFEALAAAQEIVRDRAKISLSAHKVRPPVEGLLGGVIYTCGDYILGNQQ
jgi:7,8-dihydroneopterin aldolase/epimerase/oxygenase